MRQNSSSRRLNEQARQVIAETIRYDLADPGLNMITITGCEVSFDRSACNVYFTATPGTYAKARKCLNRASGRIRSILAKKLSWRVSPKLRFFLDESVDEAERIARALERERKRQAVEGENRQDEG